jgi:hypothetical protein
VLLGGMAQMPVAGVAWQVLHYLEGLSRLGHDVVYVEDTSAWPYDPDRDTVTDDAGPAIRRLARLMDGAGFGERWAYRDVARGGEVSGMTAAQLDAAIAAADLLVNLSGMTILSEAHRRIPVRVYLETDPVAPQIEIARGRVFTIDFLAAHTHHFSFGERLGAPDCGVPVERFDYRPTRQPVVLDWWPPADGYPATPAGTLRFTTVANWEQTQRDVEWQGEVYTWTKSAEFLKLIDLPGRVDAQLELALTLEDPDKIALLESHGWRVRHVREVSRDTSTYREYIRGSAGEVSAAKDQNVRLRSGWFSDRTATYLAAGRPAVVQDTGFDVALPTGEGLFAFRSIDEAVDALHDVASDYPRHSRAAHELAREYFRAETVLERLLDEAAT